MAGFLRSYSGTLDAKNRLHLPARLRQGTDLSLDACVITLGIGGPLFLFPDTEWRRVQERLSQYSFGNPGADYVIRMLTSNSFEVSPDSQNRILIPPDLSGKVDIQKSVKVVGVLNRIEIWSEDRFAAYERGDWTGLETKYDKEAAALFQS